MDKGLPSAPNDSLLADVFTSRDYQFRRCSLVLLIDIHGRFFGQMRDDKPDIAQPGKIGFFGGGIEPGEDAMEALIREVHEETNITFAPSDFERLTPYFSWRPLTNEYEAVCPYVLVNVDVSHLEIFEGQGAIEIIDYDDPQIASTVVPALRECWQMYKV